MLPPWTASPANATPVHGGQSQLAIHIGRGSSSTELGARKASSLSGSPLKRPARLVTRIPVFPVQTSTTLSPRTGLQSLIHAHRTRRALNRQQSNDDPHRASSR
jgi:hypothetical protein